MGNRASGSGRWVTWGFISVVFPLAPLGMIWLLVASRAMRPNWEPSDLLTHGDVYLLAATLCAAAIVDMFIAGKSKIGGGLGALLSAAILWFFLSASLFVDRALAEIDKQLPNVSFVAVTSLVTLVISIAIGTTAHAMQEEA